MLNKLVEQGNTVVVIEHNLDVIRCADYLIDLGPEGGQGGGRVVAEGTPEEVAASQASATGEFLRAAARQRLGPMTGCGRPSLTWYGRTFACGRVDHRRSLSTESKLPCQIDP